MFGRGQLIPIALAESHQGIFSWENQKMKHYSLLSESDVYDLDVFAIGNES